MQSLAALDRTVLDDGAALGSEQVDVAEQLRVGLGRTGRGAGAEGAAAHVALGGEAAESVAAGDELVEGAGVGDELVGREVAPAGGATFAIEGAEFASGADQLNETSAVRGRTARQRQTPAGDLALAAAGAGVVAPRMDGDLYEVSPVGRSELCQAGKVEVGFRVTGEHGLNRVAQMSVASAPAHHRGIDGDGAGVGGAKAEVGEVPLGNITNERVVKPPAGDVAVIGERAGSGGADSDLDRCLGADLRHQRSGSEQCKQNEGGDGQASARALTAEAHYPSDPQRRAERG